MPRTKTEKVTEEKKKKASKLSAAELEQFVLKLAQQNVPASKIGLALKKEHGITPKTIEKISKILSKHNLLKLPEDIQDLIAKAARLREHLTKNKKDIVAKRGLQITEAQIRKQALYFKKIKRLPPNWEYKT